MNGGFEKPQRPNRRPEPELLDFVRKDGTWELPSTELQADVTKEYTPEQQEKMLETCREELNKFITTEHGLWLLNRGVRQTDLFKRYIVEDTLHLRHVESRGEVDHVRRQFLNQATLVVPRQRRSQIGEVLVKVVDIFLQQHGIPPRSFFEEEIEARRSRR